MGWIHTHSNGLQAEAILAHEQPGSFLVRPSFSNPGDFVISVKNASQSISHVKVHGNGEAYHLQTENSFATLGELVSYYMNNSEALLATAGSESLSLKYLIRSADPTTERWFHSGLQGAQANHLLQTWGKPGSFLIRESNSKPGDFVISTKTEDQIMHIMIRNIKKENGQNVFDIGENSPPFSTLSALIDHYRKHYIVDSEENMIRLIQPFNATKFGGADIEERIAQLNKADPLKGGKTGFSEEFESIQECCALELTQVTNRPVFRLSRSAGSKAENKNKNRFKNVLPFNETRVILNDPDESDYINANYVSELPSAPGTADIGYPDLDANVDALTLSDVPINTPKKKYIATQGPLPNTMVDFWRMVWQERSSVIVMTTLEMERGKNKCYRYWPTSKDKDLELASPSGTLKMHVKFISETGVISVDSGNAETTSNGALPSSPQSPDYIIREMKLRKNSEPWRTVFQLHCLVWFDHSVPRSPAIIHQLISDANARCPPGSGPVVVHCSAGIGRTGTYIAIDILLDRLIPSMSSAPGASQSVTVFSDDIDVKKVVLDSRKQRSGMIQTEKQYAFIYQVLAYAVSQQKRDNASKGRSSRPSSVKDSTSGIVPPPPSHLHPPAPRRPTPSSSSSARPTSSTKELAEYVNVPVGGNASNS